MKLTECIDFYRKGNQRHIERNEKRLQERNKDLADFVSGESAFSDGNLNFNWIQGAAEDVAGYGEKLHELNAQKEMLDCIAEQTVAAATEAFVARLLKDSGEKNDETIRALMDVAEELGIREGIEHRFEQLVIGSAPKVA